MNIFRRYRDMSFEQRTIIKTIVALCFSAALACGKFVMGLFSDYGLCIIAVYTFALLFAKLQCVAGVVSKKGSFKKRNALIAVFLMLSSAVYIGFMCRSLYAAPPEKEYRLAYVVVVAFISFSELGFAVTGIFRTKDKGHFYRDIKIISFCMALIAILTTQTTILCFVSETDVHMYNAYAGIAIGVFIAACAVFIAMAPQLSVVGREHNAFELIDGCKNKIVYGGALALVLCKSTVYGSYIYRAQFAEGRLEGDIVRGPSLWKRMNPIFKILCCALSEILVFAWLIGRAVLFVRSANLSARLEKIMSANGFKKCRAYRADK